MGSDLKPADAYSSASALHYAAYNGHRKVVQILLEQGADLKDTTTKAIPLVDSGSTPLHTAAGCGHVEVVDLLLARRANVRARNGEDCTPLHAAAHHASHESGVIGTLLRWGANLEATAHGETVEEWARAKGKHELLRVLRLERLGKTSFWNTCGND